MSDGESLKHSSYASSPSSDANVGETSHHQVEDTSEVKQEVFFDLSDPSDMERKLENLSEQEMDELLQQAYKVNRELNKELQRQERTESSRSQPGDGARNKTKVSKSAKASSRSHQSETGGASLPPIRKPSGTRAVGPRSFTSLTHRTSTQLYASPPVNASRNKAKTAVKQPISKPKPEWDDRFG